MYLNRMTSYKIFGVEKTTDLIWGMLPVEHLCLKVLDELGGESKAVPYQEKTKLGYITFIEITKRLIKKELISVQRSGRERIYKLSPFTHDYYRAYHFAFSVNVFTQKLKRAESWPLMVAGGQLYISDKILRGEIPKIATEVLRGELGKYFLDRIFEVARQKHNCLEVKLPNSELKILGYMKNDDLPLKKLFDKIWEDCKTVSIPDFGLLRMGGPTTKGIKIQEELKKLKEKSFEELIDSLGQSLGLKPMIKKEEKGDKFDKGESNAGKVCQE